MLVALLLSFVASLLADESSISSTFLSLKPNDEDVGKDMIEIVTSMGYQIDTYYVTTEDGYILTMFNILHGTRTKTGGPPVLLQHGLLDSSYTFVNNFQNQSLAYILSDQGFDVWFGNNRGNRYGRNHTTLNPDDGTNAFWYFTWDDMATYDVPAMIDFVISKTGYDSLSWVGHSEGTIQMFAAGTLTDQSVKIRRSLSKVNLFVALAPVAYVYHLKSKELVALAKNGVAQKLIDKELYEFLPYGNIELLAPTFCRFGPALCNAFLRTLCGPSSNLNETRLQVYVSETPAGTSIYNIDHWAQVSYLH